ncbi:acyl-CoA thioesterase [Leekyejoonella antrihumi]|uniref:Acyl-CoA thioesterase n=1 Tax=Leekyejoonella antrihumi TaxID=1660198 RepID=A0A563E5I0_9MICO|nr:thioesterase family protein [Leekyejoonella antrihumi]TWP37685.1 acyl-CoA thioesterase [Leekyejoonella antrihumi]
MQNERPYSVDIPLRWSDMDALRHINNVQVARLLEEARVLGLAEWFGFDAEGSRVPRLLIARTEIDYRRQLHYRHQPVTITMWVSKISGASFDLDYEVLSSNDQDAHVCCTAQTTVVHFDMETQRPQRIDPDTKAVLEKFQGEPVEMRRRARQ